MTGTVTTANYYYSIEQLYPQVVLVVGGVAYDADNNVVQYDAALVQEQAEKNLCKDQASKLLYETDWTTIPDVADSSQSPYLTNQAEFIAWRSQIRKLAVNPIANPTFPPTPTPVWG